MSSRSSPRRHSSCPSACRHLIAIGSIAHSSCRIPQGFSLTPNKEKAGFSGVALATGIGGVTPGGPMTSFPMVNALHNAGTGRAALIAYLTSWSTLGFQRILVWELPLLGGEFALLRELASLPLPFIAAIISERLPKDPEKDAAPK